jgi:hypothetical protein
VVEHLSGKHKALNSNPITSLAPPKKSPNPTDYKYCIKLCSDCPKFEIFLVLSILDNRYTYVIFLSVCYTQSLWSDLSIYHLSICYGELAHTAMEVGKSHHLPSASCQPRRAGGIAQLLSEGLRARVADVPSSHGESEFALALACCSIWASPNG